MTDTVKKQLGATLWNIADQLRGAMNADDFRDYMLSFLFLRYLSDNYEAAAKKELGKDYPKLKEGDKKLPLSVWYKENKDDTAVFETPDDGLMCEIKNILGQTHKKYLQENEKNLRQKPSFAKEGGTREPV